VQCLSGYNLHANKPSFIYGLMSIDFNQEEGKELASIVKQEQRILKKRAPMMVPFLLKLVSQIKRLLVIESIIIFLI